MRPSLTLPEIHERYKKHSLSQKLESTPMEKKDEQYRMFEVKLYSHRQYLEKNNEVIRELTTNFDILRHYLITYQKNSEELQLTIKRFREEIERLNKQLRTAKARCEYLYRLLLKEQEQKNSIASVAQYNGINSDELTKKLYKIESYLEEAKRALMKSSNYLNESKSKCEKYKSYKLQLEEIMYRDKRQHEHETYRLVENIRKLYRTLSYLKSYLSKYSTKESKAILELEARTNKLSKSLYSKYYQLYIKCNELKSMYTTKKESELQLEKLKKYLGQYKERISKNDATIRDMIGTIQDYETKYRELYTKYNSISNQLSKSQNELSLSKDEAKKYMASQLKLLDLSKLSGKLLQGEKNIQKSVQCSFCQEQMKYPVTIIPCGHCFCLACKKGYQKECSKCGPQVKIEALYRNELMDDIINILKILTSIGSLISSSQEK